MISNHFLSFLDALTDSGLSLLAGTTVLLLLGCAAIWRHHSPIQRQRLGELTVASVLIWLGLAFAPSRRSTRPRLTLPIDPVATDVPPAPLVGRTNVATAAPSRPIVVADLATVTPNAPDAVPIDERRVKPMSERIAVLATRPTFRVLAAIYVGGAGLCLAWLGLGTWLLSRVVRTAQPPEDWLRRTFERLAAPGRLARTRLLVSPRYPRAMSFGVWRPTIVLPSAVCHPESAEQLQHVLRHELAHIHQRDAWSNLLLNVAFVALYFHPCFWWLRSRVRISSELVADEWAAVQSSHGDYARQLVAFARSCSGRALRPAGAAGILDSSTQFARRIEMLIRREQPLATRSSTKWRLAATSGTVLCLSALVTSMGAPVRANSPVAEATTANGGNSLDITKVMSFQFHNAPWTVVLSQFAAETHLKLRMDAVPQGEFSRSDDARYSPSETLDILNKELAATGCQLRIEGQTLLVCAPSPDDASMQLKALQEMSVEMSKQAAEMEAEASKLKSTGGPSGDQLKALTRLHDELMKQAGAMKAQVDKLKSSQLDQKRQGGQIAGAHKQLIEDLMLRHRLRSNDAKRVEKDIRDLAMGAAAGTQRPEKLEGRALQLRFATPDDVRQAIAEVLGRDVSGVKILVDERTNRILIFGAGEKEIQAIDSIIKLLDQPAAQPKEPVADKPVPPNRSPQKMSPAVSEDPTIRPSSSAATAAEPSADPAQSSTRPSDPFHPQSVRSIAAAETPTDLVALAVAYSDAVGQVQEFQHEPAKLRQSQRKLRMLRGIVEVLRAAKAEQVALAESRLSKGLHSDSERDTLIERKANLAALDRILATE